MISPFVIAYVYIDTRKCKRKITGISNMLTRELRPFDYWTALLVLMEKQNEII